MPKPDLLMTGPMMPLIEDGCDEVLRRSRDSSAIAAITAARHSMEKVTRYGD